MLRAKQDQNTHGGGSGFAIRAASGGGIVRGGPGSNFRLTIQGSDNPPPSPQTWRQVFYFCNEGIPLNVTFVEEDQQSFAVYSHDSGVTDPSARATLRFRVFLWRRLQ